MILVENQIKLLEAALSALKSVVVCRELIKESKIEKDIIFHKERLSYRKLQYVQVMELVIKPHVNRVLDEEPVFETLANAFRPVVFGSGLKILNPITELHEAI